VIHPVLVGERAHVAHVLDAHFQRKAGGAALAIEIVRRHPTAVALEDGACST